MVISPGPVTVPPAVRRVGHGLRPELAEMKLDNVPQPGDQLGGGLLGVSHRSSTSRPAGGDLRRVRAPLRLFGRSRTRSEK